MRNSRWLLSLAALAALPLMGADFSTGMEAYKKGDFATAAKEWREAADHGNAASQYNLGLLYRDGKGVPQDRQRAATWIQRAAEQDYEQAEHDLGAMYRTGQDVKRDNIEAYKWLNLCAGHGNNECATQRDDFEKKMKRPQVLEAQRQSTMFSPRKEEH